MTPEIEKRIKAVQAGRVPAGYKRTKVGIVPKEWDVFSLKNISTELHETAGNGRYETLSISAGVGFVNQTSKFGKDISGAQYAKYTVLKKGDFSYNKGNSKKYPQGCVYQLKDRDEAVVPNVFESFRLINGENDFFEQLFINGFLNGQLFSKINHGVRDDGLLNLRGDDFYSCQVPFPPLSEQKKIAEILATQDRVIELKEKLIAEKQNQKKYLSQILLTGKKRVGDYKDPWEYSALSNYLTIKDVRQIPNDEAPLMAFIAGIGVSPKGERYDRSFLVKNDKKEYKRTDLNDFIYSSNNLDVGSIGLNSYGSASISVVYEIFSVNSNAVPVVLSSIIQLPENLNYALRFRQGAIYGQYRIYAEDFLSMKIKIPSLPEQKAIADVLSAADEEILLMQKDLEQEKLKKKSLMQLLLTGLVRVNE